MLQQDSEYRSVHYNNNFCQPKQYLIIAFILCSMAELPEIKYRAIKFAKHGTEIPQRIRLCS